MALLTNIDNKFSVSDAGAVRFNNAFTFPTADGDANYVLKTNGSGQLAWGPDNNSGDITGSGTTNTVTKFTGAKVIGNGPITFATNDSTFAGNVTANNVTLDNILLTPATLPAVNTPSISLRSTNNEIYFQAGSANVFNFMKADYTTMLALDGANSATFAGSITGTRAFFNSGTTNVVATFTSTDGIAGIGLIDSSGSVELSASGDNFQVQPAGGTAQLTVGSSASTFAGTLTATNYFSSTTGANIFLGSVITKPGDNLGFVIRNTTNAVIGSFLRTSNTTSKLTTDNLSLGGTTAQYVRGDGSFATYSGGGGTVTGTGTANTMPVWTSASALGNSIITQPSSANVRVSGSSVYFSVTDTSAAARNIDIGHWVAGQTNIESVGGILSIGTQSNHDIVFETNGSTKATILANGKVGIGTTGPTYNLVVSNGGASGVEFAIATATGLNEMLSYNRSTSVFEKFRAQAKQFEWYTDATANALVIQSGGNVGIGTSTPDAKLTIQRASNAINTEISFKDGGGTRAGVIGMEGATTNDMLLSTLGGIRFYTASNVAVGSVPSNERMRIDAAGMVGIGIIPGNGFGLARLSLGTGAVANEIISFASASGGNAELRNTSSTGTFTFTNSDGSSEKMRILANGNVGIGYTSPGAKLDVLNTGNYETIRIGNSRAANTNKQGGITALNYIGNSTSIFQYATNAGANVVYYGSADGSFRGLTQHSFMVSSGPDTVSHAQPLKLTAAKVTMAADVTMTGSVGIGETTLQRKFNLYDGTDTWTRVRCGASTADWLHGIAGSDHTYKWYNQSSNGGVGYKMALATSGALTVSSDVVAYGSPSDKRLKENIKPIESALDKVSKLQGVTFDWKKSDSILKIKQDIGFIAQDVQKVIPELVRENEDGMLSMRHQGIAPILLEAIKELKAEIEELKFNKCNCK